MKIEKVKKLGTNWHDKIEYVIHIRNLKHALNHRLGLKKTHRLIKFNQNAWLKPYIDMNTNISKKANNDFKRDLLKFMKNAVFVKIYGKYEKIFSQQK